MADVTDPNNKTSPNLSLRSPYVVLALVVVAFGFAFFTGVPSGRTTAHVLCVALAYFLFRHSAFTKAAAS